MKCQDLMTLDLRWVRDTATVLEAAMSMRENSIGFLPVCDAEGALIGVVTDRDLTTRAVAENLVPGATTVAEVMSKPAIVCLEEEPLLARQGGDGGQSDHAPARAGAWQPGGRGH